MPRGSAQVNYLGHWLLAHELLSHQRSYCKPSSTPRNRVVTQRRAADRAATDLDDDDGERPGTRLIFLSSMTHRAGELDFSNLQLQRGYSGFKGYANSKLATLLAAKEFQRRFDRCHGIYLRKNYLAHQL